LNQAYEQLFDHKFIRGVSKKMKIGAVQRACKKTRVMSNERVPNFETPLGVTKLQITKYMNCTVYEWVIWSTHPLE